MAQRWSFEEDIIICKYCIENQGICIRDSQIEEIAFELRTAGYVARSSRAIKNRADAYLSLLDGHTTSGIPRNIEYVYNELCVIGTNEDKNQGIRSYINEIYSPSENINAGYEVLEGHAELIGDVPDDLSGYLYNIDFNSTFPMVLQKYVELKGIKKHSAMCRKIGMKPDTFSAILRGKYKEVKKENVLKICIGLELRTDEAEELLDSAGFSLSNAIMTDVVIKAFLRNRIYSVVAINAELYENNAPMLFNDYIVEYGEI